MADLYVNLSNEKSGIEEMNSTLESYGESITGIKSAVNSFVDDTTKLTSTAYDDAKTYYDQPDKRFDILIEPLFVP